MVTPVTDASAYVVLRVLLPNIGCEQVDTYEKIYDEVDEIQGVHVFDNWFRVDANPFKQALLNIIKRWSFMFKQHLIDHVTNRYMTANGMLSANGLVIVSGFIIDH